MNIFKSAPVLAFAAIMLSACGQAQSQTQITPANSATTAIADFKPTPILPDNETRVPILRALPDFDLTNQNNASVSLDDLHSRVWLVNFIGTDCGQLCELQTKFMAGVNKLLTPELGGSIRFVSISNMPAKDTPAALSEYIKSRTLDTSQWDFLTGPTNQVSQLARAGFNLPAPSSASGAIANTTDLFLIDWEGRVRGQYDIIDEAQLTAKNDVFEAFKQDLAAVLFEQKVLPETLHRDKNTDPRKAEQKAQAKTLDIFTDFTFQDKIKQSDITFEHKIVNDVGTDYKAIHYDHGNGVAIADVDLDGLLDVYFTTLSGTNELWRNLGGGKFENITERSGLTITDRIGMGASFADIDNDGDPDLYITNVRVGNILFENDGKGSFKNITASSRTGVNAHSSGAVFFDYDRDGLLDLFVTNVGKYTTDELRDVTLYSEEGQVTSEYKYYVGYKDAFAGHLKAERNETSVLFKNLGNNTFENVNDKTGLIDDSWSGDATVIDGNNDGWPDLYIINMQGNDEYYENQDGEKFVRKSREVFPKTPWGAMGVRSFDYDNDGDMDLYVTDMHSDMRDYIGIEKEKLKSNVKDPESFLQSGGNSIFGNAFYRNDGGGKFTEISDQIGVENYWPWGPTSGDLNADGFEDLFVASSMAYPFRYHINSVFLNQNGTGFIDSEYMLGVEPRRKNIISKPWFEIDCETENKEHLVCVNSNTKTSSRTIVWGALGSRSSAVFDMDQDGDQDIITLEFNHAPMVLMSDLSDKTNINFVKIDLTGTRSNRDGIGAMVKVYAGGDVYTKVNDGKSGYLAQSTAPLYFGLGDHTKIDKIDVIWPSGTQQTIENVMELNALMEIKEQ